MASIYRLTFDLADKTHVNCHTKKGESYSHQVSKLAIRVSLRKVILSESPIWISSMVCDSNMMKLAGNLVGVVLLFLGLWIVLGLVLVERQY